MILSLSLNEKELVNRCWAGREEEYAVLYNKHVKAVFNSVYRITNNYTETEDVVQDAFCTAFEQMDKLKDRNHFGGWLRRIAINKAISLMRKSKTIFIEETAIDGVAEEESDTEDDMIFSCRVEDVKEAIRNLPDGYRTILTLHLLEDIPQEEIAKMLHIGHSTVRSQYHRAKRKIYLSLKDKNYNEG